MPTTKRHWLPEFLTYRATRLALSALIFVFAFLATTIIRELDFALNGPLKHIERSLSPLYARLRPIKAPKTEHLQIMDLALSDSASIKLACASVIDSLIKFGARGIAIDILFDASDTTGLGNLMRAARHPNVVFGFDIKHETSPRDLIGKLKRIDHHAIVPCSLSSKKLIASWPVRGLNQIVLPVDNLPQAASHMGYCQILESAYGRIIDYHYPLFQRLQQDNLLFAGLATQAFRVWIESASDSLTPWCFEDYVAYLAAMGVDWNSDDGSAEIYKIDSITENYIIPTWQNIRSNDYDGAQFANKMVLIVNSPTEEPSADPDQYPAWGYHASMISRLIAPLPSQDWMAWFILLALYAGWVFVRLWPAPLTNRIANRQWWVWTGLILLLFFMPLALAFPNLLRSAPIMVMLWLLTALFIFELIECALLPLPKVDFLEFHLVLDEPLKGRPRVSIQHAPVRLGKYANYDLPGDQAKIWLGYQRPGFIADLPEVRRLGEALYDFIMAGEVGSDFVASLEKAAAENKILRLRLRNETKNFAGLPFELVRNLAKDYGYLGLLPHFSLVRALTADPAAEWRWSPPLRLLVLLASPESALSPITKARYSTLEVEAEKNQILHNTRSLKRKGWLQLTIVDHADRAKIESLPTNSFDVVHFVGHGEIDTRTEYGHRTHSNNLVLEGKPGEADLIHAENFAHLLRRLGPPRLVFLNACVTGEGIEKNAFVNIGAELQRITGASVIAHQFEVSDYGGILLSDAFYKNFAETFSPELALIHARQSINEVHDTLPSDWVSPVYFIK